MKRILVLLTFSGLLNACSTIPPFSGSVVTDQGQFSLTPDGRVEIVVNPNPAK